MRKASCWPILSALLALGCGAPTQSASTTTPPTPMRVDVVGLTSRAEIEEAVPAWRDAIASADPGDEIARALASVPPGAEVDVFLGT